MPYIHKRKSAWWSRAKSALQVGVLRVACNIRTARVARPGLRHTASSELSSTQVGGAGRRPEAGPCKFGRSEGPRHVQPLSSRDRAGLLCCAAPVLRKARSKSPQGLQPPSWSFPQPIHCCTSACLHLPPPHTLTSHTCAPAQTHRHTRASTPPVLVCGYTTIEEHVRT